MKMFKLKSHNDLDGVGPGILAKLAFGEQVEVTYHSYDDINKAVSAHLAKPNSKEVELFITDISVNDENERELDEQVANGKKVTLIDHHKTAIHLNQYTWATVSTEYPSKKKTAATSMFYEYLLNEGLLKETNALNEFVELVRQYDTWEWETNENKKAKRLNDLFYILGLSQFEEKMLDRLSTRKEAFGFDETETFILEMEEEKIERFIKQKQKQIKQVKVRNYVTGVVFAEQYHSELGNVLGRQNPQLDLIVIVNTGAGKVSYRTIYDNVDVSEFAKVYEGGGHRKAAGSSLTEKGFREFVIGSYGVSSVRSDPDKNRYNVKASKYVTIYQNENEEYFGIKPVNEEWLVTKLGTTRVETFESFEDAEINVKREEAAWLSDDNVLIAAISKQHDITPNKIRSHFEVVMGNLQTQEK